MKKVLTIIAATALLLFAACDKDAVTPDNNSQQPGNDSVPTAEDTVPIVDPPATTEQVLDSLLHYMFGPNLNGHNGYIQDNNSCNSYHYISNSLSDLQQTGFTLDPGIDFDSCTLLYGMIWTPTSENVMDSIELVYNDSTSTYNCTFHISETFYQGEDNICYWRIYPKIDGEVEYFYDFHHSK